MHYMLIIIADETKPVPTSAERAALMQAYGDFTRQIMDSGHFRSGAALQPSSTASTVREQRRALVVTEGPFAGGRDHVAGFYIVECAHLDEGPCPAVPAFAKVRTPLCALRAACTEE